MSRGLPLLRRRLTWAAVAIVVLAVAYVGPVRGLVQAHEEHAQAQQRLEQVTREKAIVDRQVANLRAPGRLEQEARRLGLARPGETMIVITPRP